MPCVRWISSCQRSLVLWLQRLAPLKRGLYEDYVANFWCSTHFLLNWKRLFSQAALVRLCLGTRLSSFSSNRVLDVHASLAWLRASLQQIQLCICHEHTCQPCTFPHALQL